MRVVPCVLVIACLSLLAGCGLFRNQGGGDTKRPLFGSNQPPPKKPADAPAPSDDPLLKSAANGNDQFTTLAGRVVDVGNVPLPNAYIRTTCLDEGGATAAPIDVAVDANGYFTILDARAGKRYKLEARAKQDGKLVATTVQAKAPQANLHLVLKAENVLPDTPPLPPPPGVPMKPKNGAGDKNGKVPTGETGWGPGQQSQKGLSIGPPVPMGNKEISDPVGSGWEPRPDNGVPKYPENIVQEKPWDKNGAPPLAIKGGGNVPEPGSGSVRPKGGAYVPSCVVVGNRLINFALPDYYGNAWEWKSDRLGRVVLLDFWRTNCPPCLAAVDNLRLLRNKYGPGGLEVLGIAAENHGTLDEKKANVARICQLKQTNYRILMATGPTDPVLNQLNIQSLPTLILLDEQGNIVWRHEGALNDAGWRALDLHIQMQLAR